MKTILAEIFLWKGKNFRKQIFSKQKKRKKFSSKKCFEKKKSEKNLNNNFGNFFIFEKILSWNSVNFRKSKWKNLENKFCNFFIFEKKSVKSRLIHQSKDIKLSVNIG